MEAVVVKAAMIPNLGVEENSGGDGIPRGIFLDEAFDSPQGG
jgi:hypothetical protein